MEGLLVVISGPSGAGKGTVVKELLKEQNFTFSVSATTRLPRIGEIDGREYFFVTKEEFCKLQAEDALLEYAEYVDNYYGTPRRYVEEQINNNKVVVLDIEVIGALQVKEKFPDAVLVFLLPPTIEELAKRLNGRNTEDSSVIAQRLQKAKEELVLAGQYNYIVINDKVHLAVDKIKTIVNAERLKPARRKAEIEKFSKT